MRRADGTFVVEFRGGPKCGERLVVEVEEQELAFMLYDPPPTIEAGELVLPNRHSYRRTEETHQGATFFEWQGIQ